MATQAGVAYVTVAYDPVGVQKLRQQTLVEGNRVAKSWSTTGQRIGKSLTSTGRTLSRNLTLPIVATGAVAVKFAADFDASLSRIQGLVGANAKEMEFYRKSILDLAPAVAQGPTALADALYFVTSSGFKGAQALKILDVSAKASTAGLGETKTIADLLTSAITAYGSKTLSAAHATDILVAATKAGKGDPQEFASALQLNVAAAQQLGISFDQLAAATAALSTVNSNVSEDATQLSGVMQALIKPAKGGAEALHKVGLSYAEVRKEVRDKGILPALLDLKDAFHGNVQEMAKVFPNVRGLRGVLTLVGKAAQRNVSIFDQVAHSTGDLNHAFKTALTNNPEAKFEKLKAQLQVLAIVIGEQLIPVGLKFAGWLTSIAEGFNRLSPRMQTIVLVAAGFLAVIGPIVAIGGAVITVISGMAAAFTALAAGELLAAAPITLIVVGIAAIALGLVIAYKRSATFRAVVQAALTVVRAQFAAVVAAVRLVAAHMGTIRAIASAVFGVVMALIRANIGALRAYIGVISAVASHFGPIKNAAVSAFHVAAAAVKPVIGLIQTLVGWLGTAAGAASRLASAISSIPSSIPGAGLLSKAKGLLPHTGGIVAAHGMRLAGGGVAMGGTVGRDSIPALLTPGEVVLNNRQQKNLFDMLNHGGGSGPMEVNVYVGNEPVDARVEVAMRRTSRTFKAGRKWGN